MTWPHPIYRVTRLRGKLGAPGLGRINIKAMGSLARANRGRCLILSFLTKNYESETLAPGNLRLCVLGLLRDHPSVPNRRYHHQLHLILAKQGAQE